MEARVNRISLFIFHDIVRHHRDIFFHSVKKHIFKRHFQYEHCILKNETAILFRRSRILHVRIDKRRKKKKKRKEREQSNIYFGI